MSYLFQTRLKTINKYITMATLKFLKNIHFYVTLIFLMIYFLLGFRMTCHLFYLLFYSHLKKVKTFTLIVSCFANYFKTLNPHLFRFFLTFLDLNLIKSKMGILHVYPFIYFIDVIILICKI